MKKLLYILCFTILCALPIRLASAEEPHKPNSLVVMGKTVYLIGKGQKRGFQSLNEFLSYNYRASRIVQANSADRDLPEGPPMRAKPGSFVLDTSDNRTVYLIGKNGEKQALTSYATFLRLRKKNTVIWPINLNGYPVGSNIE